MAGGKRAIITGLKCICTGIHCIIVSVNLFTQQYKWYLDPRTTMYKDVYDKNVRRTYPVK
jgi:hypothetical protein